MRNDAIGIFWEDIPEVKLKKEKIKKVAPARVWEEPTFLPYINEARLCQVDFYSDSDLIRMSQESDPSKKEKLIFDIESYWNYFCIAFKGSDSGKVVYFELDEDDYPQFKQNELDKLDWIIRNFTIISFNGISYDIPILTLALSNLPPSQMKIATNLIIQGDRENGILPMRPNEILKRFRLKKLKEVDHIDLIEVAPLDASLKVYAGRLHCKRVQDLPYHPETILTNNQKLVVRWYCLNDLENTILLYKDLEPAIQLREQIGVRYGVDLRSKSDAQIAESIIEKEIYNFTGIYPKRPENVEEMVGTVHRYNVPSYINYQTSNMQWVLRAVTESMFFVGNSGRIVMPDILNDLEIPIGNGIYRMGIGGLHSSEKTIAHLADENYMIVDRDVASYYPRIILNLGLYPKHLGPVFLDVYNGIVTRRLQAKKDGDKLTAETLKITVNGSFGKTGNKYSLLYEPSLVIQTTITGQLSLLMLIERLFLNGFDVLSANTDGIVTKVHVEQKDNFDLIIKQWENDTGFDTEEAKYLALYSRDVNNYIAIKDTKKTDIKDRVKLKGAYGMADLRKTPQTEICNEAVIKYLLDRTPIAKTIENCTDITKFVTLRKVRGGAVKQYAPHVPSKYLAMQKQELLKELKVEANSEGLYHVTPFDCYDLDDAYDIKIKELTVPEKIEYLGSTVRWYYANNIDGEIVIASSGNKVPKTDGAKPIPDLPSEFPDDINYEWYIQESYSILQDIGAINE